METTGKVEIVVSEDDRCQSQQVYCEDLGSICPARWTSSRRANKSENAVGGHSFVDFLRTLDVRYLTHGTSPKCAACTVTGSRTIPRSGHATAGLFNLMRTETGPERNVQRASGKQCTSTSGWLTLAILSSPTFPPMFTVLARRTRSS